MPQERMGFGKEAEKGIAALCTATSAVYDDSLHSLETMQDFIFRGGGGGA